MPKRIKINLKANGTIWCFLSDIGPIKTTSGIDRVTIKGKWYDLSDETAGDLVDRLDKLENKKGD